MARRSRSSSGTNAVENLSVFCDSSALVKLYADEPGAEFVRGLANVVVSALARVEVPAAIMRKHRLGELPTPDASVLVEAFEWDWSGADGAQTFAVVGVTSEVLELAAAALDAYPLRAYDAVQLGTALAARAADPDLATFACFDRQLSAAAEAEGFAAVRHHT